MIRIYFLSIMIPEAVQTCFLLNDSCRDRNGRFEIILYAVASGCTPVKIIIDSFRPLFFIPRAAPPEATGSAAERRMLPFKAMTDGSPVDCLYFATYSAFRQCGRDLRGKGLRVYESDVHPAERYCMERQVKGGFEATGHWERIPGFLSCRNPLIRGRAVTPDLSVLSLDIETNADTGEILSIACSGKTCRVFIRGAEAAQGPVVFCETEKELLTEFFSHLRHDDPDVIIGWNVIDFDLRFIQERCGFLHIPFRPGRDDGGAVIEGKIRIPGRVVMDVPVMLRASFHPFEEYSLDFVASAMLGKRKLLQATGKAKIDEINRMFRDDPVSLAEYNLHDACLAREIFDAAGILPDAVERSKLSGLLPGRTGGSVAAFDYLYLPRLHRAGYVAPDTADVTLPSAPLPGGYVLEPKPGCYENVLVFDFRSLYPSIIMTFKIDPLSLVAPSENRIQGPEGPRFAADVSILPAIIAELMEARARAKQENNPPLSQAIKIIMNSFYGVLGAQGCRFFSTELASAITKTGQFIFRQTMEHLQSSGSGPVIYGDTDSLFLHIGPGAEERAGKLGAAIARETTAWLAAMLKKRFGVVSALELQYERHFRHFFMPTIRGTLQGSKKHYCGTVAGPSGLTLVFKGMESARSDWTDLAKDFQHELFKRFFMKQSVEAYVISVVNNVRNGIEDGRLIYTKRLRKMLDEYTAPFPPHVQAAKMLASPGTLIKYYMTAAGPQPVECRTAPIDREHYIECQLKPIADSVLEWLGTSFDKILSGQQELF